MDKIKESLDRLSELTPEELTALQDSILKEFEAIEGQEPTKENVDQLTALADAADAVKSEITGRESEKEELASAAQEAATRIKGEEGSPEGEEVPAEDETEEEAPTEAANEEAPVEDAPAEEEDEEKKKLEEASSETPVEAEAATKEKPEDKEEDKEKPKAEEKAEASSDVDENSEASVEEPAEASAEETVTENSNASEEVTEATISGPDSPKPSAKEEPTTEPTTEVNQMSKDATAPVDAETEKKTNEVVSKSTENSVTDADEASVADEPENEQENTVTASANGELKAPEDHEVTPKTEPSASVAITAGADIPGVSQGSSLPDMKSVAEALLQRRRAMGKTTGGDGEQHTIATFSTTYPEDRQLFSSDSAQIVQSKIDEITSTEAIVAAGGLCAPVDTSYDIFKLGENGRPVKDSLPVFNADRGGLRFMTAPTIEDLDGAVSIWTLQDDIDAASDEEPNPVKPCIRVACGEEVTVYVDAIPLCLTFGNLGARAWPELVERHTELGMISHARFAETRLLTRIGQLSTAVTTEVELGAARDFFVALDTAAAGYRSRHRLSEDFKLRVLLPEWFKSALRADLVKQLPGNGQDEVFTLAEAQINTWFNARNVAVTWFVDGEDGQVFGAQAAGALSAYPENLVWYLFSEGTFLFLDGGTLDLGLVRDSQLNGTNDYKIFLETFEAVAKVGIESLRVTTPVAIAGASAATVETIGAATTPEV